MIGLSNFKIKIMNERKINFKNKKILIYGFGKSGISCFNFLKNNNNVQYLMIIKKIFQLSLKKN